MQAYQSSSITARSLCALSAAKKHQMKKQRISTTVKAQEFIATDKAPAAAGPYSQGIKSGGLLYTCGCVAFVPETMEIVEGGIEAETRQALTNMGEILKAGGSDFSKVVKTTIFITNMADFPKVNAIYSEFFNTPGPARSTVGVASLPKGGLIEIDAIAEC
ncbi:endoribonuclease L-PSP [Bathycoccus prasinos]|uniref:Endoribonuclease L-PSP n=1 Tax=Bathycoccus prasinos TaxID=41875 RepID=K8F035_9CHLO|nr:endoribonuclease L-PSP [Bathycoccus prasinos]CCO14873.1 endoribonuclease L-PSP [Bathycoccus prasinos]|eukprot:XP_007514633.1 endoribonuclease L-PSP [Bathycoccus prasinos]